MTKVTNLCNKISQLALFGGVCISIISCGGGGGAPAGDDAPANVDVTPLTRATDLIYIADPLTIDEVFVVATDGSAHRNSTSASISDASEDIEASPNGRYLAVKRNIGNGMELFIDDLSNENEAVRVSADLVANGNVTRYEWSPDGNYLAYSADQDVDETIELYVVPVTGGTVVKLHPNKMSGETVAQITWSPDSQQIAFRANHTTTTEEELYVTNRDGSGNVKLNLPIPNGASVTSIHWSPDSSRLIFRADEILGVQYALYAVDADGNNNIKLNSAGSVLRVMGWLPDGSGILFQADQDTANQNELYRVSPDGTGIIKLNGVLPVSGNVFSFFAKISPNGAYVAYLADQDINGVNELYVSAIDGTSNAKLNDDLILTQEVSYFRWSPDSSHIAYLSDLANVGMDDLYSVPVAGGLSAKLNSPVFTSVSGNFRWSPDSQQVAYHADQDASQVFELYVSSLGLAKTYKVSDPMVVNGDVLEFYWSPDGAHLLYRADQETDAIVEAYSVENTSVATSVKVSTALAPGSNVLFAFWLPVFNP